MAAKFCCISDEVTENFGTCPNFGLLISNKYCTEDGDCGESSAAPRRSPSSRIPPIIQQIRLVQDGDFGRHSAEVYAKKHWISFEDLEKFAKMDYSNLLPCEGHIRKFMAKYEKFSKFDEAEVHKHMEEYAATYGISTEDLAKYWNYVQKHAPTSEEMKKFLNEYKKYAEMSAKGLKEHMQKCATDYILPQVLGLFPKECPRS